MKSNVSVSRQLGALLYDTLLVFSLLFFVELMLLIIIDNKFQTGDALFYLITLPTLYSYFALSWIKGRQTLGMKAWHFQIVDTYQHNISHQQAFVRFIVAGMSFVFIGLFYQLLHPSNLSLQDKYSNTRLIGIPKNP